MKRIVVIVLMMAACLGNAQAQLHLKANVQNNHLWRGMEVSDGIVLLTDLSYTMVNDHVTVGLWGGCNSEGSYKEFNHYLNLKAGVGDSPCGTPTTSPLAPLIIIRNTGTILPIPPADSSMLH